MRSQHRAPVLVRSVHATSHPRRRLHVPAFDGDVFAIVVDGADRAAMKELFYHAIHAVANRPARRRRRATFCMVSAGIAMIGQHGAGSRCATPRTRWRKSKQRGKNTARSSLSTMTATKLRRLEISGHMQTSVLDGMAGLSCTTSAARRRGHHGPRRRRSAVALNPRSTASSPRRVHPVLGILRLHRAGGRRVLEQSLHSARWTEVLPGFIMDVNIPAPAAARRRLVPLRGAAHRAWPDSGVHRAEMTESCFCHRYGRAAHHV